MHREADKFRYYPPSAQNQSNPIKELDEFYCKDEKVAKVDLDIYARDHVKDKEESKFQSDMALMQEELKKLDEGKYQISSL